VQVSKKASAECSRARRPAIARRSPGQHQTASQLMDPARRWTLPHGADQDHHGTKVDLSAEKTDRWRRHPLPAAVAIAAEAEPAAILLRQMIRPAPRCPRVVGAVEATTARASFLASRIGQVLVNRQQERPDTPTSDATHALSWCAPWNEEIRRDTPCEGTRSITLNDSGYRRDLK
jgi:hypothetical protein